MWPAQEGIMIQNSKSSPYPRAWLPPTTRMTSWRVTTSHWDHLYLTLLRMLLTGVA